MRITKKLPVSVLSGYCTETFIWQLLKETVTASVPAMFSPESIFLDSEGHFSCESSYSDRRFLPSGKQDSESARVWSLAATVYYLVMGIPAFGPDGQSAVSPVPSIPPRRCSRELNGLLMSCLSYQAEDRPSFQEIIGIVRKEADKDRRELKGDLREDIPFDSFWKEEMV